MNDVRGLASFAAERHGREERTVGLDEHAVDDEAVLAEADRSMYAAKRAITH